MRRFDPENAEFPEKRNLNYTLLKKSIPRFDLYYKQRLQGRMIEDCKNIQKKYLRLMIKLHSSKRSENTHLLRFFTIRNVSGDASFFQKSFSTPTINYVHPSFKHLYKKINNQLNPGRTEFLPHYMLNLNHVCLSKEDSLNYDLFNYTIGNGLYSKYTLKKGKPIMFSSANLVQFGASKSSFLDEKETIDLCFEYLYWNLPVPIKTHSPTINNLIYHSSNSIYYNNVLELNKTLMKIIKIRRKTESVSILKTIQIKCVYADVVLLVDDGNNIHSEKRHVQLIESVANSFDVGDIFTGLLVRQNISVPKYSVVIGSIGKKVSPDNLSHLISIAIQNKIQLIDESSSLTYVEKISMLSLDILKIIKDNSGRNDLFPSSFKLIENFETKLENSIEKLFPLFVIDDQKIYHLPSSVISFLLSTTPKYLKNKKFVLLIIKILNLIKIDSHDWESPHILNRYVDNPDSDPSKSFNLDFFIKNLPELFNQMICARLFSQKF